VDLTNKGFDCFALSINVGLECDNRGINWQLSIPLSGLTQNISQVERFVGQCDRGELCHSFNVLSLQLFDGTNEVWLGNSFELCKQHRDDLATIIMWNKIEVVEDMSNVLGTSEKSAILALCNLSLMLVVKIVDEGKTNSMRISQKAVPSPCNVG